MSYIMESEAEGARLAAKTDRAVLEAELDLAGPSAGQRVLDAGCASGAVTEALVARVGPNGHVVGVDLSAERLAEAAARNPSATFTRAPLERLPFPDGSFDYVMCRLVLEYARQPQPIVDELARVCAPGGRVVLIDVDGYGAFHHPLSPERAEAVATLGSLLQKTGFDAYVGRKLYALERAAGLTDLKVHVRPYHLVVGAADAIALANWRYKLETLAPLGKKVLGEEAYSRCTQIVIGMLEDPAVFTYSVMMLAEGRRA